MTDKQRPDPSTRYNHCLIMGGGGFRFGYYLGMYAALADAGKKPDLLLAACGGAIAAGIIKAFASNQARRDWLCSKPMYNFWCAHQVNPRATVTGALAGVVRRLAKGHGVNRIPDLHNDYQFIIPECYPMPPLNTGQAQDVDIAIVAGRLLYGRHEAGQARGGRRLYEQTVFAGQRVSRILHGVRAPASLAERGASVVAETLAVRQVPIQHAVRASVSDMYLFRCHEHDGEAYTGGVIDLQPIELASALARCITLERKSPFGRVIDQPALRSVFGTDGNRRLRSIRQAPNLNWIDTSDMESALPDVPVARRIHWSRNRIELVMPSTHKEYARMMLRQWNYGYQRGQAAKNDQPSRASPSLQPWGERQDADVA